jgi:hypothetical protein
VLTPEFGSSGSAECYDLVTSKKKALTTKVTLIGGRRNMLDFTEEKGWGPSYLKLRNFHFIFRVLFSLVRPGLIV